MTSFTTSRALHKYNDRLQVDINKNTMNTMSAYSHKCNKGVASASQM